MGVIEVKNTFSSSLDRVAQGQRVVINPRGKPAASSVNPALREDGQEELSPAAILHQFLAERVTLSTVGGLLGSLCGFIVVSLAVRFIGWEGVINPGAGGIELTVLHHRAKGTIIDLDALVSARDSVRFAIGRL